MALPPAATLCVCTCSLITGYAPEANTSADLLYSITDAAADMQVRAWQGWLILGKYLSLLLVYLHAWCRLLHGSDSYKVQDGPVTQS
jgi:hypothetical protein